MPSAASKGVWEPMLSGYAVAVIGVSVAAGGRMLLNQITGPQIPLVIFHLVILAAAVWGGLGPAVVGLATGYLIAGWGFDAPRIAFGIFGMPDLWATMAYVVVGLALIGSGTTVRAIRRQLLDSEQAATATRAELLRQLQLAEAQMAALKNPPRGSLHASQPLLESGATPGADRSAVPAAPTLETPVLRIRVVDDARDNADSLALLLTMHGYEVEVSYDGISALAADAPDVLIVDIDLPDISGYEILRRVRIDPRFARTFVIGLSGFAFDEDHARASNAGFDHYLTKPIDFAALCEVIEGAVR